MDIIKLILKNKQIGIYLMINNVEKLDNKVDRKKMHIYFFIEGLINDIFMLLLFFMNILFYYIIINIIYNFILKSTYPYSFYTFHQLFHSFHKFHLNFLNFCFIFLM